MLRQFVNVLFVLFLFSSLAYAHGSAEWIAKGNYRSPIDGVHCCGEFDCSEVNPDIVTEVPGGLQIRGPVTYHSYVLQVDEVVPHKEIQYSKDGRYWRCKRADGSVRCLFRPPPGS